MSGILFSSSLLATAASAAEPSSSSAAVVVSALGAPRWASARDRTDARRARPVMRGSRVRVFPSTQMVPRSARVACILLTEEERDLSRCPPAPEETFDPTVYWTCRPRPRARPNPPHDLVPDVRRAALDHGEERRGVRRAAALDPSGGCGECSAAQLDRFVALNRMRRYAEWQRRDPRVLAPDGARHIALSLRRKPAVTNLF